MLLAGDRSNKHLMYISEIYTQYYPSMYLRFIEMDFLLPIRYAYDDYRMEACQILCLNLNSYRCYFEK